MSIKQRIDAQTDALSALLTYANDATSAGDSDIGEAIRTLVDGYGKGGGIAEEIPLNILPNSYYVSSTGNLASYNGWSATEAFNPSKYTAVIFFTSASVTGGFCRFQKDGVQQGSNIYNFGDGMTKLYFNTAVIDSIGISGPNSAINGVKAIGILK